MASAMNMAADEAVPVQTLDTKNTDTTLVSPEPATEAEPVDSENIDPTVINLDLANAESGKKRSEERVRVLMDEMACATKELAGEKRAHQEIRSNAERQAHSWKMEIEDLRTKLEEAQIEKTDMIVRVEKLEASKDSLEEALATEETSHRTSLDAFHADKKDLIAAHETEKAKLRNIIATKEKAHEQLEARVVSLESEKVDKDKTIEEFNAENENFEESLAVEKDRCRHLQGRVNAKRLEIKDLATAHASQSRKIEDLKDSLTMSQESLNHYEVVITAYEAAIFREWEERRAAEMERDEYGKELNVRKETESELERVKALASQHNTHIQALASRHEIEIQGLASQHKSQIKALTLQHETNIHDLEAKNKKLSSILSKGRDLPV